jgi:hypothetical protein
MLSSSALLPSIVHVMPWTSRPPVRVALLDVGATGQGATGEQQVDIADCDYIAVVQHRSLDTMTVDERAVDTAGVADFGPAGQRRQGGVVARRQDVGNDDVVVGRATDLDRAGRGFYGPSRPQDLEHAGCQVVHA